MASKVMTNEKLLEFIDLCKDEEVLWNPKASNYRNRTLRAQAANEVAKKLNVYGYNGNFVLDKIQTLKSMYKSQARKMATRKGYVPKPVWFPKMHSFMSQVVEQSAKTTDLESSPSPPLEIKSETESDDEDVKQNWAKTLEDEERFLNESEDEDICGGETPEESKIGDSNKRTADASSEPESTKRPRLDSIEQDTNSDSARHSDHFDEFGKYIASLLKILPEKKALLMQSQIVNSISTAAVLSLENMESYRNLVDNVKPKKFPE